jgi:perosamine synthetase
MIMDQQNIIEKTAVGRAKPPLIPVYRPDLTGNERRYVLDCVESGWISSNGDYIARFERAFAEFTGARHAIAVCNGTVALHLALHCLGIGAGDEVIVPTFTYISSVNAIAYTGATPVFAESREADWLLDPIDVEKRITPRTRAIMLVHLYGAACNVEAFRDIARRYDLKIVEDCAEALGTTVQGRHVGMAGDVAAFSFFGNKTITTGEGGMVVTNDDALAARLRQAKGQGQSLTKRYWHEVLGFNYRMTNIAAAIGLAQVERVEAILARKRRLGEIYRSMAAALPVAFQRISPDVASSHWLVTILLPRGINREKVMEDMLAANVDTRPTFFCAHTMPMYASSEVFATAQDVAARGLSLPSYPTMSDGDVARVVEALRHALYAQTPLCKSVSAG